jgi:predicted nucleic acid-binding protein
MTPVFADAYYYLAFLIADDAAHGRAVRLSKTLAAPTLTTTWVLTEVGDGLSAPKHRFGFVHLLRSLAKDLTCTILPPSKMLFDQGFELYARRLDKSWSLTDCISFVVMREHGITDALTGDHHFEQAGFNILLK